MAEVTHLREAVAELVRDGDTVALEGFSHLIPTAGAHEIIRQQRRDLILIRMTVREVTEGLEVYPVKMRENLDATGGMLLAENVTTLAAERLGRLKAHDLVQAASHRALDRGKHLREELLEDAESGEILSPEEIDAALDPASYLGSADEFVTRALNLYREEGS